MVVHCATCNAEWDVPLVLPMELGKFTKYLRSVAKAGCPTCHATSRDTVRLGPAVPAKVTHVAPAG